MSIRSLSECAYFLNFFASLFVLGTMFYRKAQKVFPQLVGYLTLQVCWTALTIALLFFRTYFPLDKHQAYVTFFVSALVCAAIGCALQLMVVYAIFAEAMRPMKGLHAAGKIVFRWVGVVSALVAMALVTGPNVLSSNSIYLDVTSRLQQGVSVLTLCLLVFVCFTARPLGLTYRSHLFGVSLGLGLISTVSLIQAAWICAVGTNGVKGVYSPIYLFSQVGFFFAYATWGAYFAAPEPARRMVLLPTTSPFFLWNRISEVLGDAPGHVAIAGFHPEMLAPAELQVLTAATSSESKMLETPKELYLENGSLDDGFYFNEDYAPVPDSPLAV